jgi:hypothetical protein
VKPIAEVAENPTTWISRGDPAVRAKRNLKSLAEAILISTKPPKEMLQYLRDSKLPDEIMNALTSLIREQPFVIARELPSGFRADCRIGQPSPYEHLTEDVAQFLDDLAGPSNLEFPKGVTGEVAYEKSFSRLAKLSKVVTVLDPYAGSAITSTDLGRAMLIRRLVEDGVPEIHVVTTSTESKSTRGRNGLAQKLAIEKACFRLQMVNGYRSTKISTEIFEPNSRVFHHRRIRFKFDSGAMCFSLEKGIEGFATNESDPGILGFVSEAGFSAYAQTIRSNLQPVK